MSQTKERSRRNPWVRIAAAALVCLALFLTFPIWALAASSDTYTPPNNSNGDVSGDQTYKYPGFPHNPPSVPAKDGPPSTDFYIITPTIIPDHSHDTDGGKQVMLTVIVTDKNTRRPLQGVRVEIHDPDRLGVPSITGSREELHMTDANGRLQIALFPDPKKRYQISIHYLGYQPYQGRPFTVEASQEMRIELVPNLAVISPPAIVTAPGIKPLPSVPAITSPHKAHKSKTTHKGSKKKQQITSAEEETVTEPAIEMEPPEEPDQQPEQQPEQPAWNYMGGSGEENTNSVHWLILVCAAITGLLGGWRLWNIHEDVKELESGRVWKRRD